MRNPFRTDAAVATPTLALQQSCSCAQHSREPELALRRRRRLGLALLGAPLLATPAWGQDAECQRSGFTNLAPADQVEQAAGQQYRQMLSQASSQRALAPAEHPQSQRLRYIANRIIPYANSCNGRARSWSWEVNLIGSNELNAFCMPGGKIAFYYGILSKLQLSDDEVAIVMGHEISHALLEHARERMGKSMATRGAIELGAALFGLSNVGRSVAGMGEQLLSLRFSRDDEAQADALGLVLAARAGYDPRAGVTLWQKMLSGNRGAPPQWMSTHPSGENRIRDIEGRLPRVEPMYAQAAKPDRQFGPPVPRSQSTPQNNGQGNG